MFDNLIARAIVPVTMAVTGFVIFGCILLYSFIKADMTAEATRQLDRCANTVVKATKSAMMEDDRAAIQDIVSNVGTRSDVAALKIYDHQGQVRYTGREAGEQLAAKMEEHIGEFLRDGTAAELLSRHSVDHRNGYISVTLPIPNEPKCSTAACHVHAENSSALGFLSVGVSSENLEKTLALLRTRMVIFSVMVLFLTISGVTALLRMNLFLPIIRLTYNAEQAAQGVAETDLPESDHKLGRLNRDFRTLVKQRDQAWEKLKGNETWNGKADDGSDDARTGRNTLAGHQSAGETGSGEDQKI